MSGLLDLTTDEFVEAMLEVGQDRLWFRQGPTDPAPRCSHDRFAELGAFFASDSRDYRNHEAVFLGVGAESRALFGVFIHDTLRGQSQGGVRHWPYDNLEGFLRDGLRLSVGMGRKCALADLWWGGGKGIIAAPNRGDVPSVAPGPERECIFREFAEFVTSLRGAYITAEDAGTTSADMAVIHQYTRFATCIPHAVGGSGNPSAMTAAGVIRAMEAALNYRGLGTLEGKKIAMQGAGNVGSHMIDALFGKGASTVVVTDLSDERCEDLRRQYSPHFLEVRKVDAKDLTILAEPCDLLCPNALGGVLGPKTIDSIRATIVCGAANNALVDEERDARLLANRRITYVPDYVANRMGIVACSNAQAGSLPNDPLSLRHLEGADGWERSIYKVVQSILARADREGLSTTAAAEEIARERAGIPHPIWGHRTREIIRSLTESGWSDQGWGSNRDSRRSPR